MLKIKLILLFFTVIFYQGCSPFKSSGDFVNINSNLSFLKCTNGDYRNPKESPLKRLNTFELKNTINDILSIYLNDANVLSIMDQIKDQINNIPKDIGHTEMSHFDQSVTVEHVDKQILLAEKIADIITSNTSLQTQIAGTCSTTQELSCFNQFIQEFGFRIYRRPLTQDDTDWYIDVFNSHPNSYRNVIAALFSSPHFIYHVEVGDRFADGDEADKTVVLSAYERAAKLSYFYLQSLPDEELFAAAKNNSLLTQEGIQTQVDRLLKTELVRKRLTHFFAENWLKLDETPDYSSDLASVQVMLNELDISTSTELRRQHMIDEVFDYLYYMIWQQKADFQQLMTSDLVFPRTPDLAEIYGSTVWNGKHELADLVRSPANQRSGLLTRAHFLFTGTQSNRTIIRGAKVYRDFLCGELPVPADTAVPEGVILKDSFTGRETVQAMTEARGSSCIGCHQNIINPLAFPLEQYDSFGRWRTTEKVYFPETGSQKGQIINIKAVNSQSNINIPGSLTVNANNTTDYTTALSKSDRAAACFNLKLWSFSLKQNLRFGDNDCAIQSIFEDTQYGSGAIYETLRSISLQPEFMKRTLK